MACRVFISENGFAVNTTKIAANASNSHELSDVQTYECRADIKPVIVDDASHALSSGVNDNSDKELNDCQTERINIADEIAFNAHVNTMDDREDTISTSEQTEEVSITEADTVYTEMSTPEQDETETTKYIPVERDKELKVSDVLEQAIQIGEDIEGINTKYGGSVADAILPKLIFVLSKLEGLVVKHNENKSTIKALLLEQEDLKSQKDESESEKRQLVNQLEVVEGNVKQGQRQLQIQVRLLKEENKTLSKDLKKKSKKLKRKQNGGRGTVLWFLDRILFGGRIFFVTKELPRDVTNIRKFNTVIDSQRKEITRLTEEIDVQEKENEKKKVTNNELQIENTHLEIEVSTIERRLSKLEVDPNEDETDTYNRAKQKNYKKVVAEGLAEKSLNDEVNSQHEINERDESLESSDTHTDNRILITDSNEELFYCDIVSSDGKTADTEESIFEPTTFSLHEEEVKTAVVHINGENFEADPDVCELGVKGVLLNDNTNSDEIKTNEYDNHEDEDEESFDVENSKYEVKVDIHSNRKDYKKLLLAQELRNSIDATLTTQNSLEPNYDELYDHSNSDTKSDSDDNTCYHWDEVDSKTSYEDVRTITSSDEKLHLYFILDKKNMSAKKVEHDEYQHFLEKSLSLPKITNAFDSDENLKNIDTYNIASLNTVSQIREENTIPSF